MYCGVSYAAGHRGVMWHVGTACLHAMGDNISDNITIIHQGPLITALLSVTLHNTYNYVFDLCLSWSISDAVYGSLLRQVSIAHYKIWSISDQSALTFLSWNLVQPTGARWNGWNSSKRIISPFVQTLSHYWSFNCLRIENYSSSNITALYPETTQSSYITCNIHVVF